MKKRGEEERKAAAKGKRSFFFRGNDAAHVDSLLSFPSCVLLQKTQAAFFSRCSALRALPCSVQSVSSEGERERKSERRWELGLS